MEEQNETKKEFEISPLLKQVSLEEACKWHIKAIDLPADQEPLGNHSNEWIQNPNCQPPFAHVLLMLCCCCCVPLVECCARDPYAQARKISNEIDAIIRKDRESSQSERILIFGAPHLKIPLHFIENEITQKQKPDLFYPIMSWLPNVIIDIILQYSQYYTPPVPSFVSSVKILQQQDVAIHFYDVRFLAADSKRYWISFFMDSLFNIILVDLSKFDEPPPENYSQDGSLRSALDLFDELTNSRYFRHTKTFVIFTHMEELREKLEIRKVQFEKYIHSYSEWECSGDRNTYENVSAYIEERFSELDRRSEYMLKACYYYVDSKTFHLIKWTNTATHQSQLVTEKNNNFDDIFFNEIVKMVKFHYDPFTFLSP